MSVRRWQARLYPDPIARDPVQRFLAVLERYLHPGAEVLDLGAGAGLLNTYQLKGRVKRLVGVDLCPEVLTNPLLDQGIVADLKNLPLEDQSFDLAFSIYVLEHIDDPDPFVQEVYRVLKPGGYFLALTPNLYHYVTMISALTPTGFHKWYNQRRGRNHEDTFPTHYRLNSRRGMSRRFRRAGFEPVELAMVEVQPNYLTFCTPAFLLGAAYERLVNSTGWLSNFRVNIISVFQKPPAGTPVPGGWEDSRLREMIEHANP